MLVQMTKIQIVGTLGELDKAVRSLHRAGVVQLEEKVEAVDPLVLDPGAAKQRDELALIIARLDALLTLMAKPSSPRGLAAEYDAQTLRPTADVIADVKSAMTQLDAPVQNLARRREELESDRVTLPRYAKTMRQLMPLAADMAPLRNYETVALLVERKSAGIIELIRQQLPSITQDQFELVSQDIDKDTTAALLVFPREYSSAIQTLLGREAITQVRLPEELANVPFNEALGKIEARLAAILRELENVNRELSALSTEWRVRLAVWSAVLQDRLQEVEVRSRFGATRYTFVIVGWMPSRGVAALRRTLEREVGDRILLEELPVTEHDREHAPVVLSNPGPAKPFEFLVKLMALPRYGTIDPTPIMAIFLPIFFGMILGDVGYAIVVLLGAIYLYRRAKPGGMRSLTLVIIYCSLWSIVFGFWYGEFFGELGEKWFGMHAYFPRGQMVQPLFAFSIALGIVQIGLGFGLGIYQALKLRQRHELLDRVAKVIALIGIFAMLASMTNFLPQEMFTPGFAITMVGTALLMYTLGWIGLLLAPIEILGTLGNILSYLRLAAIGLSSVYLAMVANELAGLFGNIIIGIIVGGLFHALNIALGILSPTIQSLRLHYVEFFQKFYEGGGEGFVPFKREGIL
ncbi:MAG: V-type ATP synthase subunit I [Chloroflexi bacterium]|nr:V-type ATP synthase subunit I [Chloroflexota bacterium]